MRTSFASIIGILLAVALAAACSAGPSSPSPQPSPEQITVSAANEIYVYKSPTCSCCHEWESYLSLHGYTVRSIPTADMSGLKVQMGVPEGAWSCHTAVIDGYFVEGHVPIEAVRDLLSRMPDIDGIALPGMPSGSPGMTGAKAGSFEVVAIDAGEMSAFGAY